MIVTLPEEVKSVMQRLEQQGIRCYVVGGAVRDALLGRSSHQWDLAAECLPAQLRAVLPEARMAVPRFGVLDIHGIRIAPCRTAGDYTDSDRPQPLRFGGTIQQDLTLRELSINAVAWDGNDFIDPCGGRADIASGVLRCVGMPSLRFQEDPLRILRMYRFAAQLGFAPESRTSAAAQRYAETLVSVSPRQIRGEMGRALAGVRPSALEPLIAAGGLAAFGIPARYTAGHKGCLAPLDQVVNDPLARWWALCQLTGADFKKVCAGMELGAGFAGRISAMDTLWVREIPDSVQAVKRHACQVAPLPYAQCIAAFAALDPTWSRVQQHYEALCRSGEPFRPEDLAIGTVTLQAVGVKPERMEKVRMELVRAVINAPALNTAGILTEMARSMAQLG